MFLEDLLTAVGRGDLHGKNQGREIVGVTSRILLEVVLKQTKNDIFEIIQRKNR